MLNETVAPTERSSIAFGSPEGRLSPRTKRVLVFIGVSLWALGFALYTRHAWEDWYITYRASKNLATGNGLVFTPGQRVHSFTSPLGVLIPALLDFVTFDRSDDLVLWLFRLINCALLGAAALLLMDIAAARRLGRAATFLVIGAFVMDAKIVDFSINGMETGLMMFFLALTVRAMAVGSPRQALAIGLAWAGLQWTRPDSVVYIVALAIGYLLFAPAERAAASRRLLLTRLVRAAGIAFALYLPWLVWTTLYYGTPIPHTIVAKGLLLPTHTPIEWLVAFVRFPLDVLFAQTSVSHTFMPTYFLFGGWDPVIQQLATLPALVAAGYWAIPGGKPEGRALSFAAFLSHFYLTRVAAYTAPWYVPNVAIISIVTLGFVMQGLIDGRHGRTIVRGARPNGSWRFAATSGVVVAAMATLTMAMAYEMRFQQRVIETGQRKTIGLWLAAHADSNRDTVFSESLGYIGFYSQLKMYDFPGMSSPEMVAARRALHTDEFGPLIVRLNPKWVVLRPREIEAVNRQVPDLLSTRYVAMTAFDVTDKVRARSFLPGRAYVEFDQRFEVYRRRDPA